MLAASRFAALDLALLFGLVSGALAAPPYRHGHAQAVGASITTDRPEYLPGETITICYSLPGPGPITITDYSSDGSSEVLLDAYDDGTGWCFPVAAQRPASSERLALNWTSGNESGSVETVYRVVDAAGTHVLTLADSQTTVTVAVGDTIQLQLGSGFDWQFTDSDSMVLQPAPGSLPADVQGSWLAISPGQATIFGQGDPPCRRSVPACGAPSRVFSVTIVVTD
jgi:hypothetical protein